MFDGLVELLKTLNSMTPLGVIGLLVVIILLMTHKKGPLQMMKDNHLTHVQATLDRIATLAEKQVDSGEQQVDLLIDLKADLGYLKGRLDK